MARPPMLAADHIRELTRTHTTTTVVDRPVMRPVPSTGNPRLYPRWEPTGAIRSELHHVTEPPLLEQLAGVTGTTGLSDSDAAKGGYASKPAAHLGAADALARIDRQARNIARQHDVDDSGDLTNVLSRLSGAIGNEPHRRVRSWWATARLLTQHDTPAYRPHGVPCPQCWDTDTLRIRIDDELATCTACGETWDRTGEADHGSLDVLGQHVAWCADHEVTKARHWALDDQGYPTECLECLAFREAWAEWRLAHPAGVDAAERASA